ncbi:MAG: exodeoxyribonuclease VII small subunit [Anaerolineales bacterium]|jgi:exodeoxyribonuclease VII small subunit|nr:exodeoxyribonuclease VII small subunit [Anaerolineales bacterium]
MGSPDDKVENEKIPMDNLTYEQAFMELETTVAVLESGDHSLEDSLSLFERGQALASHCADLLDKAELRVLQLSGDELVDSDPQQA